MDMTNLQSLSVFLTERLTLAAQEIFKAVEVTVSEYHDEISRSRQENELLKTRLMEAGIEFYSDCPGVSALHEGAASVGRQPGAEPWGEDGADIQVKLELSATKDEPAASDVHGPAAKDPPSPSPWQEDEVRVEEALHTLMAESDVNTLLHATPLAQDVKEEPEDATADLRTEACSGSQAGGATFDQACGLEDGLEGHRLTSANKALRSKMPLSSKEKSARYRERIKTDPAAREAYLTKRKESYQRRKREGKIVKRSISQLSTTDKEKVRNQWKCDQRKHRERKRALEKPWSFTPDSVGAAAAGLPAELQLNPMLMMRR